jgi:hypothetical protein
MLPANMLGATTSSVVDAFTLETQQRQRGQPLAVAGLAIGNGDRRVPIIIAVDEPFEPEVDQRRRIDHELAGPRRIRGDRRASRSVKTTNDDERHPRASCFHHGLLMEPIL